MPPTAETDEEWSEVANDYGIRDYTQFGTTLGEEYHRCDPEVAANGVVFAVSDVGKALTEEICKTLRKEGFSADWHPLRNTVAVKTLEPPGRILALQTSWRLLVRQLSK